MAEALGNLGEKEKVVTMETLSGMLKENKVSGAPNRALIYFDSALVGIFAVNC